MKKIYNIKVNGKTYEVELEDVTTAEGSVTSSNSTPAPSAAPTPAPASGSGTEVCAPMPGVVIDIKVNVGDNVSKGQVVAILEAMKMETEILSSVDGKVSGINVSKNSNVNLDDVILTIN